MSLDAMKQALAALETNLLVIEDYGDHEQLNRQHKAITALRTAIEQPRQWQGLTNEELWELWNSHTEQPFPEWFVDFKRAYEVIAEKLKEKNT